MGHSCDIHGDKKKNPLPKKSCSPKIEGGPKKKKKKGAKVSI
jgi:hypothetical protein